MGPTIPVAHDFTCGWCWIGMHQARRLRRDFGAQIEWRPYVLYPEGTELPGPPVEAPKIEGRPDTPNRFELACAAEGLEKPALGSYRCRSNLAHRAVEHAKTLGVQDELVERIYAAYWKQGEDISDLGVLERLARGLIGDLGTALEGDRYSDRIIPFGKQAYGTGVYNLPTFWIGEERYAEQPFRALETAFHRSSSIVHRPSRVPYSTLDFPPPPPDRPFVYCNMVATIDGKTVSGSRDETVMDLGSKLDHQAMRNIESAAEAVMIGAQTLRATPRATFDPRLFRIVVTASGRVPIDSIFLTEAPEKAVIATAGRADMPAPAGVRIWCFEHPMELLRSVRSDLGVTRLLVEGGSELNASFLEEDLVDELFLTIAPKVKLGRGLPTYAGGEPLPRGELLGFGLISETRVGDEVFLRYRRLRS